MALQVLRPRGRSFVMVNAHPGGCEAQVAAQFDAARGAGLGTHEGTALVIGASTGYGLASSVVAAVSGMRTVGVFLERQARGQRTASAGWYNSAAFHRLAGDGHFSINGDAFADETKQITIDTLQAARLPVDLVVYSLASPVRKTRSPASSAGRYSNPSGRAMPLLT
jgi:enoyl-[acyl-carrier protein] reductase / trans-2-enoyl-CoA reductase (NAD+)